MRDKLWGQRLRPFPCVLLVAVALHQFALTRTSGLSPWLGGGFGMFSTVDIGSARHLHVYVVRPGIEREVRPPAALEDLEGRVLALPSDARLRTLALALADTETPDQGPASAVRVEVWTTQFHPDTLRPSSRISHQSEISLGSD